MAEIDHARSRAAAPSRRRSSRRRARWPLVVSLVALCAAVAMLAWVGVRLATRPNATGPMAASAPAPAASGRALAADRVQRMIDEMTLRTQQDPKDSSAWALLANSYAMVGRLDDAARAHARLTELMPNDPQVLADHADVLAAAKGRHFEGEPKRLLERALALDPKNVKALLLLGTEAFDRQDYATAIRHWQRAREFAGDTDLARQIDSGLAEARAFAARGGASAPRAGQTAKAAAPAAGREIAGRVVLDPALAGKTSPDDTVFVFARPALGSRMPVALLRKRVRDLPLDFKLDDSMAMVPDVHLSSLPTVVVGARISKRGDAVPQPGDLQGMTAPLAVGSRDVQVRISDVLP